jgi:SAM-dependent methyltransferase
MIATFGVIGWLHENYVFGRRVRVLVDALSRMIPRGSTVLDVGCGDGRLAELLLRARPDLEVRGIDVLVRPSAHVPVTPFDGAVIPFGDDSFDVVMFVDVLHHTDDPTVLLREAKRVARNAVVLKDHCRDGVLAGETLRLMDWVGNARHGVALTYNYWPEKRWREAIAGLGLEAEQWEPRLGLYRWPFSIAFDRDLHFVAALRARAVAVG